MILPPSGGIGHIHLVAEHIPYDTWFNPRIKRFIYCHRLPAAPASGLWRYCGRRPFRILLQAAPKTHVHALTYVLLLNSCSPIGDICNAGGCCLIFGNTYLVSYHNEHI